jgi:hypothetical protein
MNSGLVKNLLSVDLNSSIFREQIKRHKSDRYHMIRYSAALHMYIYVFMNRTRIGANSSSTSK